MNTLRMLRGTQRGYSVFFQHNCGSRGMDIVAYAKACMVSQIPGLTNVSAEAEILASSYNKAALISVRRNVRVRECVFEREAEVERERHVTERSPSGRLAAAPLKIRQSDVS